MVFVDGVLFGEMVEYVSFWRKVSYELVYLVNVLKLFLVCVEL